MMSRTVENMFEKIIIITKTSESAKPIYLIAPAVNSRGRHAVLNHFRVRPSVDVLTNFYLLLAAMILLLTICSPR